MAKQIHKGLVEEKYSKDETINIKIDSYADSDKDDAKITRKYSAEKDGITANGFPSIDDAVKELNRKFNNSKIKESKEETTSAPKKEETTTKEETTNNPKTEESTNNPKTEESTNNLKTEEPMKTIEELKKNLALAESQVVKDNVKNNPILLKSLEKKIVDLKKEIADHKPEKAAAVKKPLAVKKDVPAAKKAAPSKKEVVKKAAPAKKEKTALPDVKTKSGAVVSIGAKVQFHSKRLNKTITGVVISRHKTKGTFTVEKAGVLYYPKVEIVELAPAK
jgi:DNA-binding protein HU-beta